MKPHDFLSKLAHEKIVAAIAEAEQHTSGQIRVYISRLHRADGFSAAASRFRKLGMQRKRERNAVLIYVAPLAQTFGVVGDEAVHARCGADFWHEVRDAMASDFRNGHFTEGILHAVRLVGAKMRAHFPVKPGQKHGTRDAGGA